MRRELRCPRAERCLLVPGLGRRQRAGSSAASARAGLGRGARSSDGLLAVITSQCSLARAERWRRAWRAVAVCEGLSGGTWRPGGGRGPSLPGTRPWRGGVSRGLEGTLALRTGRAVSLTFAWREESNFYICFWKGLFRVKTAFRTGLKNNFSSDL